MAGVRPRAHLPRVRTPSRSGQRVRTLLVACQLAVPLMLLTWPACHRYQADETPMSAYVMAHNLLDQKRQAAKQATSGSKRGPRTFVRPGQLQHRRRA